MSDFLRRFFLEVLHLLYVTMPSFGVVFWSGDRAREKIHVVDLGVLPGPHGYCTESWRSAIDRQVQEVPR